MGGQVNTVCTLSLSRVVSAKCMLRADPACGVCSSVPCLCHGFVMSSLLLTLHFCVSIYTVEP